jgi:hypothetical protein
MTTLPITQKGLEFAVSSFAVPPGLSIAGLANGDTVMAWQDGSNAAVQLFSANGAEASNEFSQLRPSSSRYRRTRMSSRSPTAILS